MNKYIMLLRNLLENRMVKTQRGSRIKRYKWGVGKEMGGFVYLHRKYIPMIPEEYQQQIKNAAANIGDFPFNVVKVGVRKPVVSFFNSPDFDSAPEPTAGQFVNVNLETGRVNQGTSKYIWHHKWLWVTDDYPGFDVEESFQRSQKWLEIPDVDFSRIGQRKFWDETIKDRL